MSRTAERQVSFADWELMRQGLRLEPLLQAISDFLDDQKDMIEQVRCDLIRGLKNAETGRGGMTPQQILRSLVLMRIKNWDYRELRERIADGCMLRQFTDFYCLPVPRHDAFHRGFTRLTSETLKSINDLVVQAAVELELEDGQKLRVDTTVVQTDIHHPTDNEGLWKKPPHFFVERCPSVRFQQAADAAAQSSRSRGSRCRQSIAILPVNILPPARRAINYLT